MVSVAMVEKLSRASNPKMALIASAGDLSGLEMVGSLLLVGIYIEPEITAGGVYRSTQTIKEDVWQGVVGLILKKGDTAFSDDVSKSRFGGLNPGVGEWIVYRSGSSKRTQVNGLDCRIVEDVLVDMILKDPTIITHR